MGNCLRISSFIVFLVLTYHSNAQKGLEATCGVSLAAFDGQRLTSYEFLASVTLTQVERFSFDNSWVLAIMHYKCGTSNYLAMQSESGLYFYEWDAGVFSSWSMANSPGEYFHQSFRDSKLIRYFPDGEVRRCEAVTRDGKRCSRYQIESNCYQHG